MNTLKDQKTLFADWFENTIKEQALIRKELAGQTITTIFYSSKVEGWGIDIKDETVNHLPYGFLTFETDKGNCYRIDTNYQTWSGGIFGIMLQKITADKIQDETNTSINHLLIEKNWLAVDQCKIVHIEWNWTRRLNSRKSGLSILALSKAKKYLFEDEFVPENLVFHFDNGKKIYFFALEPDEELLVSKTYKILGGSEEIMIFFEEGRLNDWDITSLGFQISTE